MKSSTISKSKQKGKEVETAVPTIGEQQAEAEKRSFVKSCFPSEQLFPGSSTKFSWLFATIEPRCFHLSSAENLSARRLYRIRQLARPLRVFSSFFFFGFITHARPTSPLGSFTVFKGFYYCPGAAFDTDTRTFCCNDVAGLITAFVYQRSLPMFFCFHVASCTRLQHVFITRITPLLSTRISCTRSRFPLTKTHDSPPLPVHVGPKTRHSFEKKSMRCLCYKSRTELSFQRSHYPPRSRTPAEHRDGNSR